MLIDKRSGVSISTLSLSSLTVPSLFALSSSSRSTAPPRLPFPPPSSILLLNPPYPPAHVIPQDRRPQPPTHAPAALLDGVIFTWPPLTLPAGCHNARVCTLLSALPSAGLALAAGLLQQLLKNCHCASQFLCHAYGIFDNNSSSNSDDGKNNSTTTFELF